jgi:hypothetical protein
MDSAIVAAICRRLRQGPRTIPQLAADLGNAESTIRRGVYKLHSLRALHIVGYNTGNRISAAAVYGWGEGEDCQAPAEVINRKEKPADLPKGPKLGAWGLSW